MRIGAYCHFLVSEHHILPILRTLILLPVAGGGQTTSRPQLILGWIRAKSLGETWSNLASCRTWNHLLGTNSKFETCWATFEPCLSHSHISSCFSVCNLAEPHHSSKRGCQVLALQARFGKGTWTFLPSQHDAHLLSLGGQIWMRRSMGLWKVMKNGHMVGIGWEYSGSILGVLAVKWKWWDMKYSNTSQFCL